MTERFTGVVAAIAAIVAFLLTGSGPRPTLVGLAGVVLLVAGVGRVRGDAITVGAGCLFAATLLAGTGGVEGPSVVAATAAVVVAYTVGQTSVELRTDLSGADVRRLSYTHVAGTTVLVGGAAGVVLLPSALTVRPSPLGLALVLFGAVALTAALLLE